ncbi:MAG: GxxExxY protein, partial [Euryarchaeota archaeon]|nr:GxxExxY protein [Euryarchaeota archaeon]MBU4340072.1 GxxExxY protein [Euryarchaeota archaeon]MBU4453934.1 GxxExxY protein [Euryarchaeota archaeon]
MNADERRLNAISEKIIAAAFEVSNVLGVGFLEKVYENALNVELKLMGMETLPQAPLKVHYKDNLVGDYIADILVNNEIIVELKTVKELDDIHIAQCLNY